MGKDEESIAIVGEVVDCCHICPPASDVGHASIGERRKTIDEVWREIQGAELDPNQTEYGWRWSEFVRTRKNLQTSSQISPADEDILKAGSELVATIIPTGSEEKRLGRRPTIRILSENLPIQISEAGGESTESTGFAAEEKVKVEDAGVGGTAVGSEQEDDKRISDVTGIENIPSTTAHAAKGEEPSDVEDCSKRKTVQFMDVDTVVCPQDAPTREDSTVKEISDHHVSHRVEDCSTAAAIEDDSASENSSIDDTPLWRRKLIKIVAICCFCNSTNAP